METIRELTLGIIGMTCGACRRHLEDTLTAVPGVQEANVDLFRGMAQIRYDPLAASPGLFAAVVRRAGYDVEAPGHGATLCARRG